MQVRITFCPYRNLTLSTHTINLLNHAESELRQIYYL